MPKGGLEANLLRFKLPLSLHQRHLFVVVGSFKQLLIHAPVVSSDSPKWWKYLISNKNRSSACTIRFFTTRKSDAFLPTELSHYLVLCVNHSGFSFSTQIWHFCTILTLRVLKNKKIKLPPVGFELTTATITGLEF